MVTPQGVLNLNKCELSQTLFETRLRPDLQQNSLSPAPDQYQKIVKIKLGMMGCDSGVGFLKTVDKLEFDALLRYSDFQAELQIPFMNKVSVNFRGKPTQKYFQFCQLMPPVADEDKMQPCVLDKKGMLCSNNLGLLLKQFGHYVFGYFCQQFMQRKTSEHVDLEGYFIQVDLLNTAAQNLFRKHVYEVIPGDVTL